MKKAKSTVFSSSLKGKDNAYFKAMLKKKQATSHPTTEVEPQPEGDHDEHGHEPDTVSEEEEHLDHGGYGHEDNVEEEEEEKEEEEEEDESDFDSDKACKHLKELVEKHPDASETDIEQYLQGEGLSSEQIEKVQQDCDHEDNVEEEEDEHDHDQTIEQKVEDICSGRDAEAKSFLETKSREILLLNRQKATRRRGKKKKKRPRPHLRPADTPLK